MQITINCEFQVKIDQIGYISTHDVQRGLRGATIYFQRGVQKKSLETTNWLLAVHSGQNVLNWTLQYDNHFCKIFFVVCVVVCVCQRSVERVNLVLFVSKRSKEMISGTLFSFGIMERKNNMAHFPNTLLVHSGTYCSNAKHIGNFAVRTFTFILQRTPFLYLSHSVSLYLALHNKIILYLSPSLSLCSESAFLSQLLILMFTGMGFKSKHTRG